MLKTPKFWEEKSLIAYILLPFSWIYYFFYRLRCLINFKPYRSVVPVICVGNLTIGGSGKTPVAIEIAKILNEKKLNFCFLSKGYKGKFEGVKKVNNIFYNANETGDEAILLSEYGDTFISKDRIEGLKFINNKLKEKKYDFIIMDDGLQNPTFIKDKIILVVDGKYGFGNGFILPAGALRDKVNLFKKKKIDLLIIINKDLKNIATLAAINSLETVETSVIVNEKNTNSKNKDFLAFAGIAHPQKFFDTLDSIPFNIKKKISYPDHYYFTPEDLKKLYAEDLNLITTKKDWVRLSEEDRAKIEYLEIELALDSKSKLKIFKKIIE